MDARQVARFKKKLLTERKKLVEERDAQLSVLTLSPKGDASRGYTSDDLSDDGARYADRGRTALAAANTEQILAKIDRALQKIAEGTYGLSDVDGSPIPVERLKVLPYALTTVGQEDRF